MENRKLFLSVAKTAARNASELIMQAQGLNHKVSIKSTITDLVTTIDKQAERTIKDYILTNFPDHGILAEESGKISSDSISSSDSSNSSNNSSIGISSSTSSLLLLSPTFEL